MLGSSEVVEATHTKSSARVFPKADPKPHLIMSTRGSESEDDNEAFDEVESDNEDEVEEDMNDAVDGEGDEESEMDEVGPSCLCSLGLMSMCMFRTRTNPGTRTRTKMRDHLQRGQTSRTTTTISQMRPRIWRTRSNI